jgi:hypothetical protein
MALVCPSCGQAVQRNDLLSATPGAENPSRAICRTYCPSCLAEVEVAERLAWWHVALLATVVLGIPFGRPYVAPELIPVWAWEVIFVLSVPAFLFAIRNRFSLKLIARHSAAET